jgi:stress response protein SCP2
MKNIEALGFILSGDTMEAMMHMKRQKFVNLTKCMVTDLQRLVGADVIYKPMYPNFPKQVMEMSDAELYINAMMHYIGRSVGLRIMPEYEIDERAILPEGEMNLKVIDCGGEEQLMSIFTNLLGSTTSISPQDKEDIEWFVDTYGEEVFNYMPIKIAHKEILAFFSSLVLKYTLSSEMFAEAITGSYKTATDVLRLAVAMSDGDESLSEATKFRNFKRSERRLLLALLNNVRSPYADMKRRREQFIRLGEKLHSGDYVKTYAHAASAFKEMADDVRHGTWINEVEEAIRLRQFGPATIHLLKQRPGDFARKLDLVLRHAKDKDYVLHEFRTVVDKIATPLLLQLASHFENRDSTKPRVVIPKGKVAKAFVLRDVVDSISAVYTLRVVSIVEDALTARFANLGQLGNVYVDLSLEDYLVPFSQRAASSGMRNLTRGSRLPMSDKGTVRFFIHWKDCDPGYEGKSDYGSHRQSVDVDLSAVILDNDWNYLEHVSYTNLRSASYNACHSGDITSAPRGAAEFIDIDIQSVLKYGGRYVAMNVYSYSGQPFNVIPECYAGWMGRDMVQKGSKFEASTVENKIDLTSDGKVSIPMVLDLKERKIIWMDMGLTSHAQWGGRNLESNLTGVQATCYAIAEINKPNLYDLFTLHASARGTLVDSPEDADIIFSADGDVTPFDIDEIVGEYIL